MTGRTIRASAAALGGAALLAVAGCGGGSTRAAPNASAQGAQRARAGGFLSEANQSALAKELGVSTARLQQALAAARPARPPNGAPPSDRQGPGPPPAGGGRRGGQLAANLAEQLNLPTAKVQQALAKVRPPRPQGTVG